MVTLRESQLQRTTPEAHGISSSALLQFVQIVEQQIHELHSFMLLRHGAVVAEGWWSPYSADRPHMMFSLSKSFTSSAIGLAVAEKRLTVDDFVLSFFPDKAPAQVSENLAAMRVRDLLSMSVGHDTDTTRQVRNRPDGDWVKGFFEQPVVYQPGTRFLYNSGATFMLSAIITKLTGMKMLDYLQPRLLQPLGIEDATWEESPLGINSGGWGLNIKTEDIARFGQMYLQKGVWNGSRILSEDWIKQATSRQISNAGSSSNVDWEQGYGYQFWRCRHNAYRGDGAFGQYCVVIPEQDIVLAITSGVGDMQAVLDVVWDHLLPTLSAVALPEDADQQETLTRKLSGLAYHPPQGNHSSPTAAKVSGHVYALDGNLFDLQTFTLDFAAACTLTVKTAADETRIVCAYGDWQEQRLSPLAPYADVAASGVWTAEDTFTITARRFKTPFVYTVTLHFAGDQVTIEGDVNVSFEYHPKHVSMVGRRIQGQ